ncbi:MAG: GIY-YIG nuclease family protein [Planctomycetota bacterium]|nr:GIY-YIG nuclease family protein [Planctomycetota bacterium]
MPSQRHEWSIYVVRTASGALYTGISTDVERRFDQHANGHGAKALRGRGPLALVYRVAIGDRALAQRVEHALKALAKADKEAVIVAQPKRRYWLRVCAPRPG